MSRCPSRSWGRLILPATILGLASCYLSHPPARDAGAGDAARPDVPGRDVPGRDVPARDVPGRDVPAPDALADVPPRDIPEPDVRDPDAGPFECNGIRVVETVEVKNEWAAVTPRLVALPGGQLGIVTVSSDGSPTRVHYERLGADLRRLTGAVTLTDSAFSWAQPSREGNSLYVAHRAGRETPPRSLLRRYDFHGNERSRVDVPMHPPLVLSAVEGAAERAFYWFSFVNEADNVLRSVHIDHDGRPLHAVQEINMGRYGSSSRALRRSDGSHLLAYTREEGRGIRHGFLNVADPSGRLGPELALAEEGDRDVTVTPMIADGTLALVRHNSDVLILERRDLETLALLDRAEFPPLAPRPLAAQAGGRILVFHHEGNQLHIDDFGDDFSGPERLTLNLPGFHAGTGHLVEIARGVAVAIDVGQDAETRFPFVIHIECTP